MDDRRKYTVNKLDKIIERLNSIDVTLAVNTESLKDHIKRTELIEQDLKPVKKHIAMVEGALKFIALCGILATIIETIHAVFK